MGGIAEDLGGIWDAGRDGGEAVEREFRGIGGIEEEAGTENKGWKAKLKPEWQANLPKYWRQVNLSRYGMTEADYERMYQEQGGVCRICKEMEHQGNYDEKGRRILSVDHKHGTRPVKVRGLLCRRCNKVLGMVRENPELLYALARYIGETNG